VTTGKKDEKLREKWNCVDVALGSMGLSLALFLAFFLTFGLDFVSFM
jgi:hypothetical protein